MIRDLRTGLPNTFGPDSALVTGVREGAIELVVVRSDTEEPPTWITTGDSIRLDDRAWIVRDISVPQEGSGRSPGARTGRTVARIEAE